MHLLENQELKHRKQPFLSIMEHVIQNTSQTSGLSECTLYKTHFLHVHVFLPWSLSVLKSWRSGRSWLLDPISGFFHYHEIQLPSAIDNCDISKECSYYFIKLHEGKCISNKSIHKWTLIISYAFNCGYNLCHHKAAKALKIKKNTLF